MSIKVLPSALRHGLGEGEIKHAWLCMRWCDPIRIRHEKQPPHYMAIGFLPDGRTIEMVAFSDGIDWFVFHAMAPVAPSFRSEYLENGGLL